MIHHHIPTEGELEKLETVYSTLNLWPAVTLFGAAVLLLWGSVGAWALGGTVLLLGCFWFVYVVGFWLHCRLGWGPVKRPLFFNVLSVSPDNREQVGRYRLGELASLIKRVAGDVDVRCPSLLVVKRTRFPEASTQPRLWRLLPHREPLVLAEWVLSTLEKWELEGIITHELTHLKLRTRGRLAVGLCGWWREALPYAWCHEYRCDLEGARRVGAATMATALLKCHYQGYLIAEVDRLLRAAGQELGLSDRGRSELIELAEQALPAVEERNAKVREFAAEVVEKYLERKLGALPNLRSRLLKLLKRSAGPLPQALNFVNWARFDSIVADGRLDEEEFAAFVMHLETHEDAVPFEPAHTMRSRSPWRMSHPPLRNRLLFIARATKGNGELS